MNLANTNLLQTQNYMQLLTENWLLNLKMKNHLWITDTDQSLDSIMCPTLLFPVLKVYWRISQRMKTRLFKLGIKTASHTVGFHKMTDE